jgi:signal transduction histidine kinase
MTHLTCGFDQLVRLLRVTSAPGLDRREERRTIQELLVELCTSTGIEAASFHVWDGEGQAFLFAAAHPAAEGSGPWAEPVRVWIDRLGRTGDVVERQRFSSKEPASPERETAAIRLRMGDDVVGVLLLLGVERADVEELVPQLVPVWTCVALASSNALAAQEAQRQQSEILRANRRLTSVLASFESRQSLAESLNAKLAEANRFLEQRTSELARSRSQLQESLQRLEKTQEQLVHAGKMAAVGALAAGVAHEINNPLSYVVANLSFIDRAINRGALEQPSADAAELGEVIKEAIEGADRVRIIVRDLKAAVRSDEEKRGPLDVRQVLDSSLKLAANEIRHRARLVRSFEPVPLVVANAARLGQVFLNLLVNAAQAIQPGCADDNEIRVTTGTAPDGRASVDVRDTGCGIEAKHFANLFNPFFTTKPIGVGTGLGLWVCHGIVQGMGGEIRVQSTPGKGSVFTVLLPPAGSDLRIPTPPAQAALRRGNRARVLVIDDEPAAGRAIKRLLRNLDYDTVVTTSPRWALLQLESGERFAVILCDVMMPELSGTEFARAVARLDREQFDRLIFITGGVFDPAIEQELAALRSVRIDKPFDEGRLLAAVERTASGRR